MSINSYGVNQATQVRARVQELGIQTICLSPLKRALETKKIICEDWDAPEVIIEEFKECSYSVWKNLSESDHENCDSSFSIESLNFISQIEKGLKAIQKVNSPTLIIAHGGTFWTICHHLGIKRDRKISNCQLVKFYQVNSVTWNYSIL